MSAAVGLQTALRRVCEVRRQTSYCQCLGADSAEMTHVVAGFQTDSESQMTRSRNGTAGLVQGLN